MVQDITSDKLEQSYEEDKLGELRVEDIPVLLSEEKEIYGPGEIRMDLGDFYETLSESDLETRDSIDDIYSVCVLGSVLYRDSDKEDMPNDLDLILIRENKGDERDVAVVPEKKSEAQIRRTRYSYQVEEALVHTEVPRLNSFFERVVLNEPDYRLLDSAIDLNLQQRSKRQFKQGIERGDTVSESVYNHGVPLIGRENFEELVGELEEEREDLTVSRKPLHDINWSRDEEDRLQAELIVLDKD